MNMDMDREEEVRLKQNIYALDLIEDVLKKCKLSARFVVKYVLNKNYQFTTKEESITMEDVLKYQPHLSESQILDFLQAETSSDTDSVEDFQSFSENH